MLRRNVKRFRGGLVFEAHRLAYHSTLGLRVIKKKKKKKSPTTSAWSVLTPALMQDSGWYGVDFSVATPLKWGKGAGCGFARDECVTGGVPVHGDFCVSAGTDKACNFDRSAIG